jgi:nucleoside phosphorylase
VLADVTKIVKGALMKNKQGIVKREIQVLLLGDSKSIDFNKVKFESIKDVFKILVVTAKNPDKEASTQSVEMPSVMEYVHGVPSPQYRNDSRNEIRVVQINGRVYNLGVMGVSDGSEGLPPETTGFPVILKEFNQGTAQPNNAQLVITDAIKDWDPDIIIMPGIAFGLQMNDSIKDDNGANYSAVDENGIQKFCDILVAKYTLSYDFGTQTSDDFLLRSNIVASPFDLEKDIYEWTFNVDIGGNKRKCTIHHGLVISANTLCNSTDRRNQLRKKFVEVGYRVGERVIKAIGGDMESMGLASAVHTDGQASKKVRHYLFAKGISDVGDDKKLSVASLRPLAASASANFVDWLLMNNMTSNCNIAKVEDIDWYQVWNRGSSSDTNATQLASPVASLGNMILNPMGHDIKTNFLGSKWIEREIKNDNIE